MLVSYTPELSHAPVRAVWSSRLGDRLGVYYTGSYDNSSHT